MDAESERLVAYVVAMFEARNGVDLRSDATAMQRIREAADRARHEWLATASSIDVNLPFIVATSSGPVHLDERLTAAQAKRVFAGDGFAEEIAAARAEHGRVAAAKHQAEETRERAESTEKRVERVQSRNLTLIVLLVTVAVAISIAALLVSSNHESHDDHKARETERR